MFYSINIFKVKGNRFFMEASEQGPEVIRLISRGREPNMDMWCDVNLEAETPESRKRLGQHVKDLGGMVNLGIIGRPVTFSAKFRREGSPEEVDIYQPEGEIGFYGCFPNGSKCGFFSANLRQGYASVHSKNGHVQYRISIKPFED